MGRGQLRREIKELRHRQTELEQKYLDLLGQVIILKRELDEVLQDASLNAIMEKKLKRLTR